MAEKVTPEDAGEADSTAEEAAAAKKPDRPGAEGEFGGPKGPEPTRFGDWEKKGRCIDF